MLMFSRRSPLLPVRDSFVTHNVGGTLILKTCGLIESQRARLIQVEDHMLTLRIGRNWWQRLLAAKLQDQELDVVLQLHAPEAMSPDATFVAGGDRCAVAVAVVPHSRGWQAEAFHDAARRLLWAIRAHYMAC